jgi:hypothetical protein
MDKITIAEKPGKLNSISHKRCHTNSWAAWACPKIAGGGRFKEEGGLVLRGSFMEICRLLAKCWSALDIHLRWGSSRYNYRRVTNAAHG